MNSGDLILLVISLVLLRTSNSVCGLRLRQTHGLTSMTSEDLSEAGQLLDDIDKYFSRAQSSLCNQRDLSAETSVICSSMYRDSSAEPIDEDAQVFSPPLKRSSLSSRSVSESELRRLLQDVMQKRAGLEKLKRFITEYETGLSAIAEQRKRACHQGYNGYGSNCNTERVWELAHLRNAIKGGPGRRRR